MKPPYFDQLLATSTPTELAAFVYQWAPSLSTLQELKDYAAQFYFTQPTLAVQIAQKTYELSHYLAPPAQGLGCWSLGNAYLHNSHYHEAERYLRQAYILYQEAHEPLEAARLSVGLVGVMAYTGQPQAALHLAKTVEPVLAAAAQSAPADLRRWAGLMKNCGVIHELLGDYEEAITVYQRCIDFLGNSGETHLIARASHNRAYVLEQVGAFDEALAAYAHAEELFQVVQSTADLVRLRINRCHLLLSLGRYQEASVQEEQIWQEVQQQPELEQARPRLSLLRAQLYLAMGHTITPAIIHELHTTEATFAANGPLLEDGLTWLLLGRCYRAMGRIQDAQHAYAHVLSLAEQDADPSLAFWAYHGLAGVEADKHQIEPAITLYETAIQRLEQIRADLQIEMLRASYLNNKLDLYRDLAALLLRQERLYAAFEVVERSKARLMMEKLASRLTTEVTQAVHAGDDHIRPLAQQLQQILADLEKAYKAAAFSQLPDQARTAARRTIIEQEQAVQTLIGEIQRQQSIFSTLTTGRTITLAELQDQLGDAIFLQYHIFNGCFGVFVVANDGLWAHAKLGSVAEVTKVHKDFIMTMQGMLGLLGQVGSGRVMRRLPSLLEAVNNHLVLLYEYLFRPLSGLLPDNCHLIVSPDAFLHSIPFHALYDGQSYLVEKYIFSYAPSATSIEYCRRQASADKDAFLIGYDDKRLAAIESELQMLAHQYPTATLKAGDEATTTAFFQQAPQHRLIHVAAHAAFRQDKPMLSSIKLADRRLTLAEISQQVLSADLVTLSGCETGAGQIQGSDILSLASGFLGAGARSLLVSLWRVEDITTAQLMTDFYTALRQNVTYATALTNAQRALLTLGRQASNSDAVYQHPVFWAPFLLLGG